MSALFFLRNAARCLAFEFFALSLRRDLVSVLTSLSRLYGCVIIAMLTYAVVYANLPAASPLDTLKIVLIALSIAIPVGVLATELALAASRDFVNSRGHDFTRRGPTLGGLAFRETYFADGRWVRREIGPARTLYEWTDSRAPTVERTVLPPASLLGAPTSGADPTHLRRIS